MGSDVGPTRTLPFTDSVSKQFWDATRDRRLLIQRDPTTGDWLWPPRSHRTPEWDREPSWEQVTGSGTVWSFSVIHRSSHPYPPTPYVLAIVELDEGVHLTTNLVEFDPESVKIGLPVQLAWEPLGDGRHLPVFAPMQEGG